jgi:phosphatidate phosphatase APP1
VIQIGSQVFKSARTKSNGEFSVAVHLSDKDVEKVGLGAVEFRAILAKNDSRVFEGYIFFPPVQGINVISDIDDTIKLTQVRNQQAALRSTFLEPFKAVHGMAQLYQSWSTNKGAQFYYVSASPWQLFLPLKEFLQANQFPMGMFCLKEFRLKDKTRFSLLQDPEKYKPGIIEPLFRKNPGRKFVLVGDSGERDPEIYGDLARKFKKQVSHIFIRDVTEETGKALRYKEAFRDLPAGLWTVFRDPAEIVAEKFEDG